MPKVARFYCLKCCSLVELQYLPGMKEKTREMFKEMEFACLCSFCIKDNLISKKKYIN